MYFLYHDSYISLRLSQGPEIQMLEYSENDLTDFRLSVFSDHSHMSDGEKDRAARWIMPGETVTIGSYSVSGGFIYLGKRLRNFMGGKTEAALIDPELPIDGTSPDIYGNNLDYWPNYSLIHPQSRAAYLQWLSGDRDNLDIDIGYVFLYFYGLERRLLRDAPKGGVTREERLALMDELQRLKVIYGHKKSFKRYVTRFLSHIWAIDRQNDHSQPKKEYLYMNGCLLCALKRALAKAVEDGKPVGAELALVWLKSHPFVSLQNSVYLDEEVFDRLFKLRFKQQLGDGLVVEPNKKKLRLEYTPASPSLKGYPGIICNMPDVSLEPKPINMFKYLADSCIEELRSYFNYLSRSYHSSDSLKAFCKLPVDLAGLIANPRFETVKSSLKEMVGDSCRIIPVSKLYALFDKDSPSFTKRDLIFVCTILERAGFGMAPDVRYHGERITAKDSVVLFSGGHEDGFLPSPKFFRMKTILYLGSLLLNEAPQASGSGIKYIEETISSNACLSQTEKKSLHAWFQWKIHTHTGLQGLNTELKALSSEEKQSAGHLLVRIATADGKLSRTKIRQLEKLYTVLGLDKASVASEIHAQSVRKIDGGLMNPNPRQFLYKTRVELDRTLLDMHEKETEDVQDVLHAIFADEGTEGGLFKAPAKVKESKVETVSGLDSKHSRLYKKLITREEWPLDEVRELCSELGLMVDGAVEVINDWAFEKVDAPLIESGDLLFVDLELVEEIN